VSSPGRSTELGVGFREPRGIVVHNAATLMVTTRSSINIVAAFGLALGAVLGMAGTFVAQPNIQALLWAIDGAGLVMAAALLALKYFRTGDDLVSGGFLVFAIAEAVLMSETAAG